MSLRSFLVAVLTLVGRLSAQPDPVCVCRGRVSVAINTKINNVSAHRRGGLANGDYMILWDAKLANGRTMSGYCEVNPLSGRVVRFGTSEADWGGVNRAYRLTPEEAEGVCRRAARARFSPGNAELSAEFLENMSTEKTYKLEWQNASVGRTIRKGRCEIDSATGHVLKLKASDGW
jgi:hypothetical protein